MLTAGASRGEIRKATHRGDSTIDKVAKAIGHRSPASQVEHVAEAKAARSARAAERRARLQEQFEERALELLDAMGKPHVAFNFGGKDNTYAEHKMDEPDAGTKRALMQAARDAARTAVEIDRHDNRTDDAASAVDEWLRHMIGDAAP